MVFLGGEGKRLRLSTGGCLHFRGGHLVPQLPLSQEHWAHRCYWHHWHRWVSRWGHQRESHCYLFRRQYQRVQKRSLPAQVAQQETFQ